LIQAAQSPHRVLCAREIQDSIKDSVHRLLSDQIEAMGLGSFFEVLRDEIRGKNGSLFLFKGLSDQTADSVKSFEGCTRVWLEEAQSISKRSWSILTPTIRAPGSEIWATYNPQLDTDETHRRAVGSPYPDTVSIEMNWRDNPWFPPVLEQERQHDLKTLPPEEYAHKWEGQCLPAVEGAIYAAEVQAAYQQGRVRPVPVDPMLKTHAVFDLGWNDSMSIILAQRQGSEIRVVGFLEDSHRTLADYSADLKAMRHNWGQVWLPHDARAKNIQTGRSAEETMRALGWDVRIIPQDDVENGIRNARLAWPRIFFDQVSSADLLEHLKRYKRNVSKSTGEATTPCHDEHSHAADAFRYLTTIADQMQNASWGGEIKYPAMGLR
jgi:phage terminase large subunit